MAKVYWIERDAISIASTNDYKTFSSPDEAKDVTMFTIKEDESFVDSDTAAEAIGMTESPNIPDEFHEALAYRVIQQGYERKPESIQMAMYFAAQFKESVAEAKKAANKELDGSNYFIKGHDY